MLANRLTERKPLGKYQTTLKMYVFFWNIVKNETKQNLFR